MVPQAAQEKVDTCISNAKFYSTVLPLCAAEYRKGGKPKRATFHNMNFSNAILAAARDVGCPPAPGGFQSFANKIYNYYLEEVKSDQETDAYDMDTMCDSCGEIYGGHSGTRCPKASTKFKPVTETSHITDPVCAKLHIKPTQKETKTMSANIHTKVTPCVIETVVVIDDQRFDKMTDEHCYNLLEEINYKIKDLESLPYKPKAAQATITALRENCNKIVALMDARTESK